MKRLIIMRPLPIAIFANDNGFATVANLLTPNPKEIETSNVIPNTNSASVRLDMGAVVSLDTFLFGFTNGTAATTSISVYSDNAAYSAPVIQGTAPIIESGLVTPVRHGFVRLAAPVASRYWRVYLTNATGGNFTFSAGVVAVGLAFEASWGHEYGAGRLIEDTSTVDRLFGGAFGINAGAVIGGYQWTFGDLQPAELQSLYALVRELGQSRTCLVVEDPDQTAGLAERIHWSLFDKLEAYERLNPLDSKWAFKIRDWG